MVDEFYELLFTIGQQMGTPLQRDDDKSRYRPCQVAAARTRAEAYDGIRYQSAMRSGGTSLVFFNPDALRLQVSELVRVTGVEVRSENC